MSVGFDLLRTLMILLPGFLTLKIVEDLAYSRPFKTDLERVIQGLVYTFIDNSLVVLFLLIAHRWDPILETLQALEYYAASTMKMGPPDPLPAIKPLLIPLIALYLTALFMGLLISWTNTTGILYAKFFNPSRLSQKSGRTSTWVDVFIATLKDEFVAINFTDGRRLIGMPTYFSDEPEDETLFLINAYWVDEDPASDPPVINRPIPGRGILILKNWEIESIEFLNPAK